ncbi:putative manganese transporter [Rhodococcus jostii]|uniref:putative manganese transporter n=1 Tax=Rhodococcus jostii TaxID=132919 RepID=UPI00364E779D
MGDLLEALGDPLVDAFLGIGVLVALMLAVMGWARGRWGARWDGWLLRYPKCGPLLAATLSLPPGCSGVIATVTLYGQRRVTYGTVIAALLATMGDSAWLLLAADPMLALELKALFFVVGALGGSFVDWARIEPRTRQLSTDVSRQGLTAVVTTLRPRDTAQSSNSLQLLSRRPAISAPPPSPPVSGPVRSWWKTTEPCCVEPGLRSGESETGRPDGFLIAFWSVIAVGIVLAIPAEFNLIDEEAFPTIFGMNSYMAVGLVGFAVACAVFLRGRSHQHDCDCVDASSRLVQLRHTAYSASFMIVLVGLVTLASAAVTEVTGFDPAVLPFHGALGVIVASLVGLLPSCGLEVVVAGLFLSGGLPLPALLAYLISHDGAGLLPLFAVHRRSAIISTVLTTVPALLIGFAALVAV